MGDRAEGEEMGEKNGEDGGQRMAETEKKQDKKGKITARGENKERAEMNCEAGADNEIKEGEDENGKGSKENANMKDEVKDGEAKDGENEIGRNEKEMDGETRNMDNGIRSEREGGNEKEESLTETQTEPIIHNLAGEWELDRSDNYDEFLKAIGLNVVARRIATQTMLVTVDIDQTGDEFVIRTLAGPFTPVHTFTVGQTCHIREPDGTRLKLNPRWTSKGLKVECTPIVSGTKQTNAYTITRQPTLDDRLITKLQAGNVVCTRVFRKARKR